MECRCVWIGTECAYPLFQYAAIDELIARDSSNAPDGNAHSCRIHSIFVLKRDQTMENIGFLIDMDGVIYRGNQLIPGADKFIQMLRARNLPFVFLTNNSQRSRLDVATKLRRMGIDVEEKHVFTCAMSTARFLAKHKTTGTAYVIGEGGLLNALHKNGIAIVDSKPDFVVVGEGRTVTLEMLEAAVQMILDGAKLIATNLDPNCPTKDGGTRPGFGATVAYLETATGATAFSLGKPSPLMMRAARKELRLTTSQTVMIGDTMSTDILGGVQMGYRTILVLSRGTSVEDVNRFAYSPDCIVGSLADLCRDGELRLSLPEPDTSDDSVDLDGWRTAAAG